MFTRLRYDTDTTEKRYKAQKKLPKSNDDILIALPYAWHLMQSFTKIENGITRVLSASIVGNAVKKNIMHSLTHLFSFDERLRMMQRLIKNNNLIVCEEFRQIQAPGEFGHVKFGAIEFFTPVDAFRTAMSYRNVLAHDGFLFGVSESENGFRHTPIIDPSNNQRPWVHLYHVPPETRSDGKNQISFNEFVWRLSNSLPFHVGPPMFREPEKLEFPIEFIENAIMKQNKSQKKMASRKNDMISELIETIRNK